MKKKEKKIKLQIFTRSAVHVKTKLIFRLRMNLMRFKFYFEKKKVGCIFILNFLSSKSCMSWVGGWVVGFMKVVTWFGEEVEK